MYRGFRFDKAAPFSFEDDLSREVFNTVCDYRLFGEEKVFLDLAEGRGRKWLNPELMGAARRAGCSKYILYGSGYDGAINKQVMDLCGTPVLCFCDGNPRRKGSRLMGTQIISKEDLPQVFAEDVMIIVSSRKYKDEITADLLAAGIPRKQVFVPGNGNLFAWDETQYFDLFRPKENEVFVDGGAYRGETSISFAKWAGGAYRGIIAIEPTPVLMTDALPGTKKLHGLSLHQCALWDREEMLSIDLDDTQSRVGFGGTDVPGMPLDEIVGDTRVTYIKMDLEGSEIRALEGARGIITRDKPRLAVCVYHERRHILEIPQLIKEMVPEYRLWLRHYNTNAFETVLYCSL